MTVLLVLFTFATFLLIDHYRTRRAIVRQPALQVAAATRDAVPRLSQLWSAALKCPKTCVSTPVTPGR